MNQSDEIEGQAFHTSDGVKLTSQSAPTFSVIVAAYNAADYIERAVRSVQAQTLSSWELLVADDCSQDDTARVVGALQTADPRIRYIASPVNTGPGGARNRAMDLAQGEWIAVLDADDAWLPDRLEKLLRLARAHDCDVVADNYIRFDDTTRTELEPVFPASPTTSPLTAQRFLDSERPLGSVRFGLLKPVIRLGFLNAKRLRYSTEIRYAEDFLFFITLLLEGARGYLTEEPLYIYTLPRSPVTGKASAGTRTIPKLADRVWLADHLIDRYGDSPNPGVRGALLRYRRGMADILTGQQAHLLWSEGRKGAAVGKLLANPWAFFAYAWNQPSVKRIRLKYFPAKVS
jgi:succinoglycan biosynthesis protein ExoO